MNRALSIVVKLCLVVLAYLLIFSPETLWLDPRFMGGVKPIDMWYQIRDASRFSLGLLLFWLGLATLVKLGGILCAIMRWRLLLRGQGISFPFWYMAYLFFGGRAIGMFLPGTLGLDGWRLVESARYTQEWVKCTTVIAIEKLIGFISLTFLVFITFPFGFRLLDINLSLFTVILAALFSFTLFCFLLLFNPRIIMVAVAVVPTPARIRQLVNRLGMAATAYSGQRGTLLLAVLFGLGVHVAICLMTFCTMMAIRAPNTTIFDIFFASPIMIYASVLTPTVNGMGVRELIFGYLLGTQSGYDAAVTYGHLGLWTGEFVPFLLSIPLLILGGRPDRARLRSELAELKAHAPQENSEGLQLSMEQVQRYRNHVYTTLAAGLFGGLAAGGLIGLLEAGWLFRTLSGLAEVQMYSWGPLVYGLVFAGVGLGVAAGLLFIYLLFDRFASWCATYALSFAGAFGAGGLVIGIFRYKRDVLAAHAAHWADYLKVAGSVAAIALAGLVLCYVLARLAGALTRQRPVPLLLLGCVPFVLLVFAGVREQSSYVPAPAATAFNPPAKSAGPNIILVSVDTLRADFLKLYDPAATAQTPALAAFAADSVLFQNAFSQASWTKPSFATIFTGLYPEQHTATSKTAAIPDSVDTLAELLYAGGYYTKGFPNNPNVSPLFDFGQGFVEYTYLEPRFYFSAESSSSKLALYNVLRLVKQQGSQRLSKFIPSLGRMVVTDFYQPAEIVTKHALDWLDGKAAPEDAPFYLYLHYMDPHDPFMDPDAPQGGYARVRMEHPAPELAGPMKKAYVKEIEYLDHWLAALFDGLKQRGLYDNTLIVFTSDHGEEFFEHKGWWHGQTLYDEVTKVPLLLKLPGNLEAGVVNADLARHIDLAPTLLRFAGREKPPVMPGQVLYDVSKGFMNSAIGFSFAQNDFEGTILESVRSKGTKIINANEDNERKLAPVELYDLAQDPAEQKNLAGDPAAATKQQAMQETVSAFGKVVEENAAEPAASTVTQEVNEQIKSLGYL